MSVVSGFSSWLECAHRTAVMLIFGAVPVVGKCATIAVFHTSKQAIKIVHIRSKGRI